MCTGVPVSKLSPVFVSLVFGGGCRSLNYQDENKDGVFTVQELIHWIETNKFAKFESEGRDADMEKIMKSPKGVEESSTTPDEVVVTRERSSPGTNPPKADDKGNTSP
jgi:hypothetical protein